MAGSTRWWSGSLLPVCLVALLLLCCVHLAGVFPGRKPGYSIFWMVAVVAPFLLAPFIKWHILRAISGGALAIGLPLLALVTVLEIVAVFVGMRFSSDWLVVTWGAVNIFPNLLLTRSWREATGLTASLAKRVLWAAGMALILPALFFVFTYPLAMVR